jgi:hypothetical protein
MYVGGSKYSECEYFATCADNTLMFADLFSVEIQNYIGIRYYVNYLLLPPFFVATTPPNENCYAMTFGGD